jgi:hypothetical protein
MTNKVNIIAVSFYFLMSSCVKYKDPNDIDPNYLFSKAEAGDTLAYEQLKSSYYDYDSQRFSNLAFFMADSIGYKIATVDILVSYSYKYKFYYKVGDTIYLKKMSKTDSINFMKYFRIAKSFKFEEFNEIEHLIKFK